MCKCPRTMKYHAISCPDHPGEEQVMAKLLPDGELQDEIRNAFATAWQDGYGCAKYPNYKERTDMHTDRVVQLIKQYCIQERIAENQLASNGMVVYGIPVLDYKSPDNYSNAGRYFNRRNEELTALKDKAGDRA